MKRVVKGSPEHLAVIRGPLLSQIGQLNKQVEDLTSSLSGEFERYKFLSGVRDDLRQTNGQLADELKQVRQERNLAVDARLEVARLEGVIQGLERAGKIDPVASHGLDGSGKPWS